MRNLKMARGRLNGPGLLAGLLVAGVLLGGCTDEPLPVEPAAARPAFTVVSGVSRDMALVVLDDVRTRIMPSLGDEAATAPLVGALDGLSRALESSADPGPLVRVAQQLLESFAAQASGDDAEIDVLRHSLDRLLEASPAG